MCRPHGARVRVDARRRTSMRVARETARRVRACHPSASARARRLARVMTATRPRASGARGGGGGERDDDDGREDALDASERTNERRYVGVTGMRNFTVRHGSLLQHEDGAFGDLRLGDVARAKAVRGVRVRQHVNPLSSRFQTQAPAPTWGEAYDDASRPLTVDIGCAGGRFDLLYAKRNPERNVLGVDIREPLVERGLSWGEASGITGNAYFATCNATVSIGEWIKSYQENGAAVELVTILHPDPHFKKRHRKRRIVQERLVRSLADALKPGARVYLQSDVEELTEDMRDKFERYGEGCFDLDPDLHDVEAARAKAADAASRPPETSADNEDDDGWRSTWAYAGWLSENPIGVPSEREVQTLGEGLPVYRVMLRRTEKTA